MFTLYGLYDPIENDLRYIGITQKLIQRRLYEHIKYSTNYLVQGWVKQLKQQNLLPQIKPIKICGTYDELLQSEIDEIKKYRDNNINLYNLTSGGDSNPMCDVHKDILIQRRTKKVKELGIYAGENNPNFKYNIKKDDLIEFYNNQHMSTKILAKMFGCTKENIIRLLIKYEIPRTKIRKHFLTKDQLVIDYNNNLTILQISVKYNISYKYTHKLLKKHKIICHKK